jgi:hypothetical protein
MSFWGIILHLPFPSLTVSKKGLKIKLDSLRRSMTLQSRVYASEKFVRSLAIAGGLQIN